MAQETAVGGEGATTPKKQRLNASRVLDGAMVLADEIGIEAFTIRKLADALDTKPMTIYHHIPNKEAIIDGMVDRVFAEIDRPPTELDWRTAMRQRCVSVREVLARHPWAVPLMESRTNPGPELLGHHDSVLGCLRQAGFSMAMIGHAYALLDNYVYGFALQEASLPATGGEDMANLAEGMMGLLEPYPNMAEFTVNYVLSPGYDFRNEFDFGLDLILDGLTAAAAADPDSSIESG